VKLTAGYTITLEDLDNARRQSETAAAKLFEKHPHFTIFPDESVELMPVLPIPGS